jgi:hypothetical protein
MIAGAAAKIAGQFAADCFLVHGLSVSLHDVDRRHDHTRRAEAALKPVLLMEGLLHGMQLAIGGQSFDCGDGRASARSRKNGAALYSFPIDVNDASAALAGIATHMGAREPQVVS